MLTSRVSGPQQDARVEWWDSELRSQLSRPGYSGISMFAPFRLLIDPFLLFLTPSCIIKVSQKVSLYLQCENLSTFQYFYNLGREQHRLGADFSDSPAGVQRVDYISGLGEKLPDSARLRRGLHPHAVRQGGRGHIHNGLQVQSYLWMCR